MLNFEIQIISMGLEVFRVLGSTEELNGRGTVLYCTVVTCTVPVILGPL